MVLASTTIISVPLLLVLGWQIVWPDIQCDDFPHAFSGLRDQDGQCVGVTDGSYVFHSEFQEVQEDVKAENDWVADQHEKKGTPAVKIALLSTLSVNNNSALGPSAVRHGLEGAYVAQKRANHSQQLGDPQPLVQLYLANEGSRQQGWETAVDRVIDMTDDDIPLVIVMGQSTSTQRTIKAANRLSDAGIPMVTAATTATTLDHNHINGLVRAAPSNTDYAKAIRQYLDGQEDLRKGILVFDTERSDEFSVTLKKAFQKHLDDYIGFSDQPYQGDSIGEGGADVFFTITQNVCESDADMVFFSGRAPDLEVFVESLRGRTCVSDHLRLIYVDLGLYPRDYQKFEAALEDGNMTVLHATGYDPGWPREENMPTDGCPPEGSAPPELCPPEGFADFWSSYGGLVAGVPEPLDDGYAVVTHDSMATAVRAVRITNRWEQTPPEPRDVGENLLLLNGRNAVRGATGTLHFNENRGGNPGGKYVPIVPFPEPDDYQPSPPYITPIQ